MCSGDESEWSGDYLAGNTHSLQGYLQGQRTIVEQTDIVRLEIILKFPSVAVQHWTIVGQPLVVPDLT